MAEPALDFPYAGNTIRQDTPVGRLIAKWRLEAPKLAHIAAARHDLYDACLTEIREMMDQSIDYNPHQDYRVRWAHQLLESIVRPSFKIDPGLQDVANFLFGEPPTAASPQHRAANDC